MRTGLIAAVTRTNAGELRAELLLAGRSVLAWQAALMRDLGAERILCLCEEPSGEVLRLQHAVEADGAAFHALSGFAALPALVRAEDELIILRDGLVPDPSLVRGLIDSGPLPHRGIACLPADHLLVTRYPEDFERIDAARHWAGLLVMRGAPVQQLADFSDDSDAVSVLLRLALQDGTPCREVPQATLEPEAWLLAESARAVALHEKALIAQAAPQADWRAPMATLAAALVQRVVPRGLAQGAAIAAGFALLLVLGGAVMAALGVAAGGLALAAVGAFAARVSGSYARTKARLFRQDTAASHGTAIDWVIDFLAALTVWFALSPWPEWTPMAVCGPLALGLARLAAQDNGSAVAAMASDRASHFALLALAASFGLLPEAVAAVALSLLVVLLLRKTAN